MIFIQIVFLFFFFYPQSSSIIDIAFTVKNLSTNEHLKLNFYTMINSLFQHTSIDNLRLHIIGDSDSHEFVDKILENLHYNSQVNQSFLLNRLYLFIFLKD